ncbi:MAG: hypothetical protein AAFQ82_18175 [Myxococcota bacterium]
MSNSIAAAATSSFDKKGTLSLGLDNVLGVAWERTVLETPEDIIGDIGFRRVVENDRSIFFANLRDPVIPRTQLAIDYAFWPRFTAGVFGGYARRSTETDDRTSFQYGARFGYSLSISSDVALWTKLGVSQFRTQARPSGEFAAPTELLKGFLASAEVDLALPLTDSVVLLAGPTYRRTLDANTRDFSVKNDSIGLDLGLQISL